jgi:hypothetical protein
MSILNRRTFLRGAGSVAIALPLLESMIGRASAQVAPKRFLVCFAGASTSPSHFRPSTTGAGYAMTRGIAPLAGRSLPAASSPINPMLVPSGGFTYDSVVDDVTVISNLYIPWNTVTNVPEGGRTLQFHASTPQPLLTGTRCLASSSGSPSSTFEGPSADQIVAPRISGDARLGSIELRVQPGGYRAGDGGVKSRISYRQAAGGSVSAVDPIASPRVAFERLFGSFEPPTSTGAPDPALRRRRSILDAVRTSTTALTARLAHADRLRIDQHLTHIRELERLVMDIPDTTATSCRVPADPGADPPVALSTGVDDAVMGWAEEERRAQAMVELVRLGFACDLVRSGSLMFTYFQSFMNVEPIFGVRNDQHEVGHGAAGDAQSRNMGDVMAWHVKHFATLIAGLRDTPEGTGTVLDSAAMVLLMEGGYGFDPEAGANGKSHSSEGMAALIAGGAGGLRGGQHLDGGERHPASVTLSAMRAVGVDGALGDVAEPFPGLTG